MSSVNNYSSREQMAFDIWLCGTNEGHKTKQFVGTVIWNKFGWNINVVATATSFMHSL